ncbi:hypothetical protein GCM10028805_09140 [Spirosoma harenae]
MKQIITLVVVCLLFIVWILVKPDQKQLDNEHLQLELEAQERFQERTDALYKENQSELVLAAESEIRYILSNAGIRCLGVKEVEPRCLWVAVEDDDNNLDALSISLCHSAKKQFFKSLTIVNAKGNSINTYTLEQLQ